MASFVKNDDGSLTIELMFGDGKYALRSATKDDISFEENLFADPVAIAKYADGKPREKSATRKRLEESWIPRFERGEPHGPFIIWDVEATTRLGHIVAGEGDGPGIGEIGYILTPSAWGKGVASAAVGAIVTEWAKHVRQKGLDGDDKFKVFGGEALSKIEATASPGNVGSWKVLTKNGFIASPDFDLKLDVNIDVSDSSKETYWTDFEDGLIQKHFSDGSISQDTRVSLVDPLGEQRTVKYDPRFNRIKYFFEIDVQGLC